MIEKYKKSELDLLDFDAQKKKKGKKSNTIIIFYNGAFKNNARK